MNKFHFALFCLFTQSALAQQTDVNVTNTNSIPVSVNNSPVLIEYRVVGFTTTLKSGDIYKGYSGMHRLCAEEVHPSARAAFSVEFIRSFIQPGDMPSVAPWIIPTNPRPFYRPDLSEGDDHQWSASEEAGGRSAASSSNPRLAMENALNCEFYSNKRFNRSGLIGTSRGVKTSACNIKRPIACAAPVAIPVYTPPVERGIVIKPLQQGKIPVIQQ